ncbi:MAG TPA: GTPase Era [Coriobacteriia bacterium]|nr:GTPase Era [Coriobacteriia bacterium]
MGAGPASPGPAIRSGFAALVGRPNAGKSTLVNAVVGAKIAITSPTPQTTRHRLRGIHDAPDAQIVFIDTPGLHKPRDTLGEELNRSALMALADVDVACLVIDASATVGSGDRWVARQLARVSAPAVLVLTKADIVDPDLIDGQVNAAKALGEFADVVVVSAVQRFNIEGFVAAVTRLLPEGPRYFPEGMSTDQPLEVMVAEFIREKVLHAMFDEIPHAVGVAVETLEAEPGRDLTKVAATLYVERESQKGMMVGKGGSVIRRVGTEARPDLERLLGTRIFLDLRVKVKRDWRRDGAQVSRFGYGKGA